MEIKTLTVFTPTYNRAYCLHLGYEALKRQSSKDFKWLIIDDGSTDNTKTLVDSWIAEDLIDIEYHYKENGGMHTGHNTAYRLIDTELNVCIDSDDWLPDHAVRRIIDLWRQYGNNTYAGLIGLDVSTSNHIIGTKFPEGLNECTYSELAPKYKVVGDKKIIYRTDVVKKYPSYPIFDNEKFVPLYFPIVIDMDYKLLCYNEIFCVVDYQIDGSTINILNQYIKNPKGFAHSRKIEMEYLPYTKQKFKSAIHYISSSMMFKNKKFIHDSPNKFFTIIAIPFGILLYLYVILNKNKTRGINQYVKK